MGTEGGGFLLAPLCTWPHFPGCGWEGGKALGEKHRIREAASRCALGWVNRAGFPRGPEGLGLDGGGERGRAW